MESIFQIVVENISTGHAQPDIMDFGLPCYKKSCYSNATEEGLLRVYSKLEDAEKKLKEFKNEYRNYRIIEFKVL